MPVDIWTLKSGDLVQLEGGATAQISKPTEDGRWVHVRYVKAADDPDLVGATDLCSEDEIIALVPPSGRQPKA